MDEIITKAIVMRTTLYRDSDKIVTLFSLEYGKITAILRGCTKPEAKLKFAGQLFCFAEFTLVQKGDNYTIINASEIESFFDIAKDYEKLSVGTSILEICDNILNVGEPNANLFICTLKALKSVCVDNALSKVVLSKFFLDVFKISGYQIEMDKCKNCGGDFNTHILLDIESGNMLCGLCRTNSCMEVSYNVWTVLKMINNMEYDKLSTFKTGENIINEMLVLLNANFTGKFQHILKSLKNL